MDERTAAGGVGVIQSFRLSNFIFIWFVMGKEGYIGTENRTNVQKSRPPFFGRAGEESFFVKNQAPVPLIQTFIPGWMIEAFRRFSVDIAYAPYLEKVGNAGKKKGSRGRKARRQAALELANFARNRITDTKLIDMYLQRTDLTEAEKTKTLGEIVARHGKIEFLLSRIYAGGGGSLELSGTDNGDFPNRYQAEIGAGSRGGYRWCTSFAGYLYHKLGLAPAETQKSQSFLSGYRLHRWATTGKGVGRSKNKVITPVNEQIATLANNPASGSVLINKADWKKLRLDISNANKQFRRLKRAERKIKQIARKKEILTAFFAGKSNPQTGDILVIGGKNNNFVNAHSHTIIVDRFDSAEFWIYSIEGNLSNGGIKGRKYDLKDASTLDRIIFLLRMGSRSTQTPTGAPVRKVDPFELFMPMDDIIRVLVRFASDPGRKWICSSDPDATAAEWTRGPLC